MMATKCYARLNAHYILKNSSESCNGDLGLGRGRFSEWAVGMASAVLGAAEPAEWLAVAECVRGM